MDDLSFDTLKKFSVRQSMTLSQLDAVMNADTTGVLHSLWEKDFVAADPYNAHYAECIEKNCCILICLFTLLLMGVPFWKRKPRLVTLLNSMNSVLGQPLSLRWRRSSNRFSLIKQRSDAHQNDQPPNHFVDNGVVFL